jgi:hypothetical protein
MSGRAPSKRLQWKTEHIPADDPFARFAASAQVILVRRMIAANRNHWRKYNDELNRTRGARARALQKLKQAASERLAEEPGQAPACAPRSNFAAEQRATR